MRTPVTSLTIGANTLCMSDDPIGLASNSAQLLIGTSTKLYTVDDAAPTPAVTDRSTHGLGAAPALWGLCTDGAKAFVSCNKTDNAASVGVRTWDGTTYSTFSATGVDSLAFLNNTLYGLDWATGNLYRFDTAGTATSLFTWKDSAGNPMRIGGSGASAQSKIFPFGGKLGILLVPNNNAASTQASLWIYDGVGVSLAASFPGGFLPYDTAAVFGEIYVSGTTEDFTGRAQTIYSYGGGNVSRLWKSQVISTVNLAICPYDQGLMFCAVGVGGTGDLRYYDANAGGIHTVSTSWAGGSASLMSTSRKTLLAARTGNTAAFALAESGIAATTSTLTTSLFDFDSSLTKLFRGITVDYDEGVDGDGGSVDVAYQTDSVKGSYTSLATGITSGTENLLSNISGRSLSAKLTLNKGTSSLGPVVKKVLVRGVPVLTRYKQREYVLDCSGDPATNNKRILRNGDIHPLSGRAQVDALIVASELLNSTPSAFLTITDRLGSYTGIIDSLEVYEEHPSSKPNAGKSGSFTVKIVARGI